MAITIRTCELEPTAKAAGGDAFTNSEVGNNAIALSQAISLKRIADAQGRSAALEAEVIAQRFNIVLDQKEGNR